MLCLTFEISENKYAVEAQGSYGSGSSCESYCNGKSPPTISPEGLTTGGSSFR
jgi:hypothetical protein